MPYKSLDKFDTTRYEEGSALELTRQAFEKLPTPDYVMNDALRAFTPSSDDDCYFTLEDGRYINRIYSGLELRQPERDLMDGFKGWVLENSIDLPLGYTDAHNFALRFLNTNGGNYQKTAD